LEKIDFEGRAAATKWQVAVVVVVVSAAAATAAVFTRTNFVRVVHAWHVGRRPRGAAFQVDILINGFLNFCLNSACIRVALVRDYHLAEH
jgi:hypothetical protein